VIGASTEETTAKIFNIQHYSVHDGPGIRTTVFFKGCPLKCQWCSNPESQASFSEIGLIKKLCNLCGRCVEACPADAIHIDKGKVKIQRERCQKCGHRECIAVCYPGALKLVGQDMSLAEVLNEVKKDRIFYSDSEGGVTLSGGEPLNQPDFTVTFLKRCREVGLHTCLDTSGLANPRVLKEAAKYTDLFLYDLKHMDPEAHRRWTGAANHPILENARLVAAEGIPMIIRVTTVPGINDSVEDVGHMAAFARDLGNVTRLDLLPYHRLGTGKYKMLGRRYSLSRLKPPDREAVEKLKDIIVNRFGLECTVGG